MFYLPGDRSGKWNFWPPGNRTGLTSLGWGHGHLIFLIIKAARRVRKILLSQRGRDIGFLCFRR